MTAIEDPSSDWIRIKRVDRSTEWITKAIVDPSTDWIRKDQRNEQ